MTAAQPVLGPAAHPGSCGRAPIRPDAYLPPELQKLMATAVAVIDRHTNAAGRCRKCAQQWPCSSAQLADLTLGGF